MKKTFHCMAGLLPICSLFLFFYLGLAVHTVYAGVNDELASNFTLSDTRGNQVRLDDYKGKTILLYFMTTWCPNCREAIPHLKEIYARYSGKGLVFFGIAVLEAREKVDAYAKKRDLPYPVLLDTEGKVSKQYGAIGVPVMALINSEGRIICWNCRSIDKLLEKQFK